ncbi:MAG: tRNA pseudouridine(38-40) synthase TruA [Bacteroidetes bacterium]|nr:tRNA pseudouridine(38-40) synthase TruA [Bacteroidota bacterium]
MKSDALASQVQTHGIVKSCYLCPKKVPRYFAHLAYDGTAYHGWQAQDNAHSVQTELEKCLSLKLNEAVRLTGCGRTDTGVHARNFFAHFDLEAPIDADRKNKLVQEVNHFLPTDIVLFDLISVAPDAHARFDATSRTYKYYINTVKQPFSRHYAWYVYGHLDVELMQQCADFLCTVDDFTSFSKLHSPARTNICKLSEASWTKTDGGLVFTIIADRFLRNMVRAIVGTLVEVGRGRRTYDDFVELTLARNRNKAGLSAPAHGLFLEEVCYPGSVFVL